MTLESSSQVSLVIFIFLCIPNFGFIRTEFFKLYFRPFSLKRFEDRDPPVSYPDVKLILIILNNDESMSHINLCIIIY